MQKSHRILTLFSRLLRGERVNRSTFAAEYEMSERSLERDLRTIREVLADSGDALEADGQGNLVLKAGQQRAFNEMEVLFIAKVLLGSRALCADEMKEILRGMSALFPAAIRFEIKSAIQDELAQYTGPQHGKKLLHLLWKLTHVV